jgi:2-oxo-4-hydroxy-4-carboxy-5-ureidoimidazoline decarboxylase
MADDVTELTGITLPKVAESVADRPIRSIAAINALSQAEFVKQLGFLYENASWVIEQTWNSGPFRDPAHLYQALCKVIAAAPFERQVEMVRAQPDLAGKAAIASGPTHRSPRSKLLADLDRLTPDEYTRFHHLNSAYRKKFGFPFIIALHENSKETLLRACEIRLQHEREEEVAIALQEIEKIAHWRLFSAFE